MPQLTIDVTTEVATRMRTAYGVATNAELKAAIIHQIKDKVVAHELLAIDQTESAKLQLAKIAKNTALETAKATAEAEIVIS